MMMMKSQMVQAKRKKMILRMRMRLKMRLKSTPLGTLNLVMMVYILSLKIELIH